MKRYAQRCIEREAALRRAVDRVVAACRSTPDVHAAYVFGSFARGAVGPVSDLDVLIVRDTALRTIERAADIALAARGDVPIEYIVVTPEEYVALPTTTFGQTLRLESRCIYAA